MAHQLRLTDTAVNALLNGGTPSFAALFDSGYIRVYDGTQPATGGGAITTQVLLAELRFSATAFGSASGGTITANSITSDSSADASGTPSWARVLKSDGSTVILDGSAGISNVDFLVNAATINSGQVVTITGCTITAPKT